LIINFLAMERIKLYEKAIEDLHEAKMVAVQSIFEKEIQKIKRDQKVVCLIAGVIIGLIIGWPF
jgi:F0F1-type ATP synthase assembly protein I